MEFQTLTAVNFFLVSIISSAKNDAYFCHSILKCLVKMTAYLRALRNSLEFFVKIYYTLLFTTFVY